MKWTFFALGLIVSGCTTPTIVPGPDGTEHNLIACLNIADCYQEAAKTCGGPYEIVHTANQGNATGLYFYNQPSRINLLIKCKNAKPATPPERP